MDNVSAARALGMNEDEIVDVIDAPDVDGGSIVETHDGVLTLVVDGKPAGYYGKPAPAYTGDVAVHEVDDDMLAEVRAQLADAPKEATREVIAAQQAVAGAPVAVAQIENDEAGTRALVDDPGPQFDRSEPNGDTGARNLTERGNTADPGTVVPEGSAKDVEDWVGSDATRARQALDFEQSKDNPRKTLIAHLEKVAGAESRATD